MTSQLIILSCVTTSVCTVCVREAIHKSKVLVSETFRFYHHQMRPKIKHNPSIIKCYLYNKKKIVIEKDSRDFLYGFSTPIPQQREMDSNNSTESPMFLAVKQYGCF